MIFKDYYKILALETNKVDIEEIKNAYREQAKKFHPDVNVGNTNAEERFKDVNEAYKILSNPQDRKKYDRAWNAYIGRKKARQNKANKKSAGEDMFSILFGDKENKEPVKTSKKEERKPIQGENVETQIDVSIEDAFYGKAKEISLRTVSGKMKKFNVKIPEGIRNGEKIRLLGQGKEGINGGRNGDLLIKINIKDSEKFQLVGNDIYQNIYISPWEAVLGAKVETKSIENEEFSIYIPKGIQTGETIKVEQKGYKDGMGSRGDLILKTQIVVPRELSDPEKEIYKQLKKVSKFEPRKMY